MATMNTAEVTYGAAAATGAIWVAPKGTSLPTDASTSLSGSFVLLGFTSDAGVQISESRSQESIRAWEARKEVVTLTTEYTESVSFTPIQCNADVAKLTWGNGNVSVDAGTGALTCKHTGDTLDPVVIVVETTPATGIIKRYCGTYQLSERGEQTLDGTQVDGRQLTFKALADETGVTTYEYTAMTATTTTTTTTTGA